MSAGIFLLEWPCQIRAVSLLLNDTIILSDRRYTDTRYVSSSIIDTCRDALLDDNEQPHEASARLDQRLGSGRGPWASADRGGSVDVTDEKVRKGGAGAGAPIGTIRAAEYVRMSTEHQRYSTENQADAI
jgi:hypothetical protein